MDPSCTIGFLCSNLAEFQALRKEAEKVLAPPLQKGVYPFFSFSDLSLEEMLDSSVSMRLGSLAEETLMFAEGSGSGSSPRGRRGRKRRSKRGSDILDGVVLNDEEDFVVVECTKPPVDEGEWEGEEEEASTSQDSDGEMVFLSKSDVHSSGVDVSGTEASGGVTTADGFTSEHGEVTVGMGGASGGGDTTMDSSGGEEITVGTEVWHQVPGGSRASEERATETEDRSLDPDEFQWTL